MAKDLIRYDVLTQEALRAMVQKLLLEISKTGLPGEHHFFITFRTKAPGVKISNRLLEKYPQEMTIVLQHQFWDLNVGEHAFEIGLSFNAIPERLYIPFSAIKTFLDPSVQFGLQFDPERSINEEDGAKESSVTDIKAKNAPLSGRQAHKPDGKVRPAQSDGKPSAESAPSPEKAAEREEKPAQAQPKPHGGAEVVSLDKFRKKN